MPGDEAAQTPVTPFTGAVRRGLSTSGPIGIAEPSAWFVYALLGADYDKSPYTQTGERVARLAAGGFRIAVDELCSDVTDPRKDGITGRFVVNRGVFQDVFTRVRGTDEFIHTVSGFDFQRKVVGRGPLVLQEVGRKAFVIDLETGEETLVFQSGHTTLPEGSRVSEVFCAAVS